MSCRKSFKPTEYDNQVAVMAWAEIAALQWPELELLFHIPNGGSRNKIEAARMKKAGIKPGIPDLCLPVPRGGKLSLWIEMKTSGGKTTPAQEAWLEALANQGHAVRICRSAEEAIFKIARYLRGEQLP